MASYRPLTPGSIQGHNEGDKEHHCALCSSHQQHQQKLITEPPSNHTHFYIRAKPLTLPDLLNLIVQLLSVIAAIIFGAWAIKSYNASVDANEVLERSLAAQLRANVLLDTQNFHNTINNKLAFVEFCAGRATGDPLASSCANAPALFSALAGQLATRPFISSDPRSSSSIDSNPESRRNVKDSLVPIVAACIGAVVLAVAIASGVMLWKAKKAKRLEKSKKNMGDEAEKRGRDV